MDLRYSPEHESFRQAVRDFLARAWPPAEGETPASVAAFRDLATAEGYLYRNIPRAYGGSEQPVDLLRAEIIAEEFGKAGAPMERRSRGLGLLVPTLLEWGEEWQKRQFIPGTLTGEYVWCQGYSEPNAGSDLASLRTRAELQGERWVINGQKVWSSDAHIATHMFMLVRTEPAAPKHQGISYLLLDLRQPSVTIRPLRQITGDSEFNEVFFDDATTPADWIVGPRGRGWEVSRSTLKAERTNLSGVQFHNGMFKRLVRLAKETQRDGRPAIEDPIIRDRLAALQGRVLATTYSTYRHLSMAAADQDAGVFPLMMKLNGSELAQEMYRVGRDIIGDDFLLAEPGQGGVGRREARAWARQTMTSLRLSIAGGASNIQRNIIAERGLALPRDERTSGAAAPPA
ncbi:MAG: acyl-CoA dehydrogenase family protein [Caulobacteraceae bacterium]|nr:acyl-CoA dehydrogenase family protein [Caulobacteraceae bacterium]